MLMQKRRQTRPHIFSHKLTSILCLLVLGLAIPLAVLNKGNIPGTSAATSTDVTVDFGSRQNKAHPIPSTFIGSGGVGLKLVTKTIGSAVSQANFRFTKLGDYDYLGLIFPTASSVTQPSQQSWTHIDEELQIALAYHLQPMIELAYTPSWLQPQNQKPPQPNPCLGYNPPFSSHSVKPMYIVNGKDQGPQMWGRLAALVVAHVDNKFPQAHPLYEIWNQPDGSQFLCAPKNDPNPSQYRYNAYRAMFAAAAPQMKQQAQKDGVQIKIGGPALVYALQNHLSLWLPNLLKDPAIYPYVDFISYHRYIAAPNFNSGGNSFVAQAQDSLFGIASQYEQVAKIVRAGKQPNAANTPIYMDEYSLNTCAPNHCVNDPITSPLMNALFVMDFLNAVNDTKSSYGVPKAVPATIALYSWDIPLHYLCMFGVYDAKWDCGIQNGNIQPYPEYYVYELLGGSNYLNISDSGYVANSASANPSGVFATGFYTKSRDSMVIVNTTGKDYTALNVLAQNPGTVPGSQANIYTISFNRSNPSQSISTRQVSMVHGSNGYTATVHLPANTVIAISFAA
jgi:hypothetical protein